VHATSQRAAWQDRANPTRAALEEALRLGMPAFPCLPNKKPATPNGFKDATADPGQLKQLWRQYPGHLVGVPTGEATGLFVVDVDSAKHPEAQAWLNRNSAHLNTRRHQTKSGGVHLLFEHHADLRNTASKLAKGVDTRGDGGYVIWWPFHLGLAAKHDFGPIAPLPDWILQALLPPPVKITFAGPTFGKSVGQPHAAVQGVLNAVACAHNGNRNSILYWAACCIRDMIANRQIGENEGAVSFHALTSVATQLGLSQREIARTIQSAVGRK
jgi:hypothetical protein